MADHCAVGVCSSPVHCKEIGRCFSAPDPTDLSASQLQQVCAALGWQGGTFWQVLEEVRRLRSAAETLERMGYTYRHGAALWKPPLGARPAWADAADGEAEYLSWTTAGGAQ